MEVETVVLYSGEEVYIVNADEVSEYLKLGFTKKKQAKSSDTKNDNG